MQPPSRRSVSGALVASVVSTAVHYTDNAIYVEHYPQPDWINPELVYIVWSLLTLIGIAGYLFFREGRHLPAGLYLLVYSYTGISSAGHYLYGSFDDA
jgi:drug/metabolite transporter (DMT)-like permease